VTAAQVGAYTTAEVESLLSSNAHQIVYVSDYATGGDGGEGSPWTGWSTAIEWNGTDQYLFPAGYYGLSVTWTVQAIPIHAKGLGKVVIKWSGGASPMIILANSTLADDVIFTETAGADFGHFWLDGGGAATHGVQQLAYSGAYIHDLEIGNLAASPTTTYAYYMAYDVQSELARIRHTKDRWTTHPTYGLYIDEIPGSGASGQGTYSAVFTDLLFNGCTGKGIYMKRGSWNQFFGCFIWELASTATYGLHLDANCFQNQFHALDSENNVTVTQEYLVAGSFNEFIGCNSPTSPGLGVTVTGDGNAFRRCSFSSFTTSGKGTVMEFCTWSTAPTATGSGSITNITRRNPGDGTGQNFIEFVTANGKGIIGLNEGNGPDGWSFANTAGDMVVKGPAGKKLVLGTEDATDGTKQTLQLDGSGLTQLWLRGGRRLYATRSDGSNAHTVVYPVENGDLIIGDAGGSGGDTTIYGKNAAYITANGVTTSFTASGISGVGANITSLNASNISSGTLATATGGTGLTSYALGDLLYSSATNILSKLSGNTTTTKKFLNQTGNGSISAAPTWSALVAGDIPTISANQVSGGDLSVASINVTSSVTASTFVGSGFFLTSLVGTSVTSGTVATTVGGTGLTSYATGDTLYASATNTLSKLSGNTTTTKKFLNQTGNGSVSAAPLWGTLVAGDIPNIPESKVTNLTTDLDAKANTSWFINKRLAADFSTTTGYANVDNGGGDALSFAIGANEVWSFEFHLGLGSASSSGLRLTVHGAQTPTTVHALIWGNSALSTSIGTGIITAYGANGPTIVTANTQIFQGMVRGCIKNGGSADTVYLQIMSLGGQAVTVKQDSYLTARRVS